MSDAMMQEMDIARKLLKKHGKVTAQAIKELRNETDMPIWKCADMLKCLWHDMELAQLLIENKRLRELAEALLTSHEEMCMQRGNCFGCTFFYEDCKVCPYVKISRAFRKLEVEVTIHD